MNVNEALEIARRDAAPGSSSDVLAHEVRVLRAELGTDRNAGAVRITRERLHKLEGAEEALRHVAAERDKYRAELERLRPIEQRAHYLAIDPLSKRTLEAYEAARFILWGES